MTRLFRTDRAPRGRTQCQSTKRRFVSAADGGDEVVPEMTLSQPHGKLNAEVSLNPGDTPMTRFERLIAVNRSGVSPIL